MAADKSFLVDFKKLAVLLLPTVLRKPVLSTLAQLITSPVSSIHNRLQSYRKDNIYRLQHNGQICYLQAALNDKFDPLPKPEGHRFRIQDADTIEPEFIYWREVEYQAKIPQRVNGEWLVSARGYSCTDGFDFEVIIPNDTAIVEKTQQIRALTNYFKLAGKRFNIKINNE